MASKKNHHKKTTPAISQETKRVATWDAPVEAEETVFEHSSAAIMHQNGSKGRRSAIFPRLNITATAKELGVTKSHLAKVLAGVNRPSIELALRLADLLGTDINVVIGLYKSEQEAPAADSRKKKKKLYA